MTDGVWLKVSEFRDRAVAHRPPMTEQAFEDYLDMVESDRSATAPRAIVWSRWEDGVCVLVSLIDRTLRTSDAGAAVAEVEAMLREARR